MTFGANMKKPKKDTPSQKKKKDDDTTPASFLLNEPAMYYQTIKKLPQHTTYAYKKFDMLANKMPLTLKEWATIVHLSDRTLQRYAKENKAFEGIYADRLLQIEKVMNEAARVFKKPINFYEWLHENHTVFNHTLSIASLQTQDGIQMLLDELGRMQQGVYI
jgi:putative toxin-antitoxin system antitoxin component (TIGR02293 family)